MSLSGHLTEDIARRCALLSLGAIVFFVLVVGRLAQLQIVQRDEFVKFAVAHGVRRERVQAQRGHFIDRHGELLVWNQPSYEIVAIPQEVNDIPRTADSLATLIGVDAAAVRADLTKPYAPYQSVVVRSPASVDDISKILAWKSPWPNADEPYRLRGIEVRTRFVRSYTDPALASHVFGYLKEIDEAELKNRPADEFGLYERGDILGATGLEAQWDRVLRGHAGYNELLVDARGYEVTPPKWLVLQGLKPIQGPTMRLTLDARLQRAADVALGENAGAVVALDPRTGAVLAMVSRPGFDLSKLQSHERGGYWRDLILDPQKPLYHRAALATYPPGSTYKIVIATAGLAEGVITPEDSFFCGGGLPFGGRVFGCWRRGGHGRVNLNAAITGSCDVFFYQTGLRLGPDRIAKYAKLFGLGEPTGIDLPHERGGLIPTTEWKHTVRKQPWQPGETLSISIGQGYDLVTPLQSAVMIATVANGGKRVRPYLIEEILGVSPDEAKRFGRVGPPKELQQVIPPEIIAQVQRGVIDVVNSPNGTARRLAALNHKIAGKTGTAQVVGLLRAQGIRTHMDHAWFVAYAPYDDPRIAVAAFVEHGGAGSRVAAPVAGAVIDAFMKAPANEPPTANKKTDLP